MRDATGQEERCWHTSAPQIPSGKLTQQVNHEENIPKAWIAFVDALAVIPAHPGIGVGGPGSKQGLRNDCYKHFVYIFKEGLLNTLECGSINLFSADSNKMPAYLQN